MNRLLWIVLLACATGVAQTSDDSKPASTNVPGAEYPQEVSRTLQGKVPHPYSRTRQDGPRTQSPNLSYACQPSRSGIDLRFCRFSEPIRLAGGSLPSPFPERIAP